MEKEKNNFLKWVFCFLFFLISFFFFKAQASEETKKKIQLIHADSIEKNEDLDPEALFLKGNVQFKHEDSILFCNEATYYEEKNKFLGSGNIKIESKTRKLTSNFVEYDGNTFISKAYGDPIAYEKETILSADSLIYNSKTKISRAIGNALVRDKEVRIKSDFLEYNSNTKQASYPKKGSIYKEDDKLSSEKAIYYSNDKKAEFFSHVELETKDQKIHATKGIYYTKEKKMDFFGPTTIEKKGNKKDFIYTEKGTHYSEKKFSEMWGHSSSIYHDGKILKGNHITYDHTSGFGKAIGNVWIEDKKEKTYLYGGYGEIHKEPSSFAIIKEKPILIKELQEDKLYIHAQTIRADKGEDGTQIIKASTYAKIFKTNLQGKCESIIYKEAKKEIEFFNNPIIWIEGKQITGDKMFAYLTKEKKELDYIEALDHVFVVDRPFPDKEEFNQMEGNHMKGLFEKNKLKKIIIKGNAQSIFYVEEEKKDKEKKKIGINHSTCGIIEGIFNENQKINEIICNEKSKSNLYPESKIKPEEKKLPGFLWQEEEKPKDKEDIFIPDLVNYRKNQEDQNKNRKELKEYFEKIKNHLEEK